MSEARVQMAPGWWPQLLEAVCDRCGWRGPVRDAAEPNGRLLVRLDADEHSCRQGGAA